jgi:hypothetical protein
MNAARGKYVGATAKRCFHSKRIYSPSVMPHRLVKNQFRRKTRSFSVDRISNLCLQKPHPNQLDFHTAMAIAHSGNCGKSRHPLDAANTARYRGIEVNSCCRREQPLGVSAILFYRRSQHGTSCRATQSHLLGSCTEPTAGGIVPESGRPI